MKRVHCAILVAEVLSYALIITFIFADMMFDLTSALRADGAALTPPMAAVAACLVALVATINVWLTYFYMRKAQTMQDWVIVCAWTHRIKSGSRWLSLEDFLTEHLGCQVSHGLSEEAYRTMRNEIDDNWRNLDIDPTRPRETAVPAAAPRRVVTDNSPAPGA